MHLRRRGANVNRDAIVYGTFLALLFVLLARGCR